ncbi:MAG: PAS domain-containing protein [Lachnospiraceae bacterium]|nr:PAS domain-containing protein [Lachnospiraceae bacterium]
MQTPIDFGKSFLNSYFSVRDPDLCLEDMAYDVVWITPKQMYHFRTAKEIRDFLEQEMTAKPARYYVDIVSIKSSPSAADISTVAYEINLVSKEEEKAVYLRCSMAICKRGQHFEISFIHMSEKNGQAGMEQVREFTENLPCGVLIFAYMKNEGLKTLFYNEYFWKKLRYKEDVFQRQIEKDTFFMVSEEDREKIQAKLREIQGTSGHLAVSMTFFRKDGNRFQYRMIGAPAYQEGDNTVYYCVFQETTAFNMVHEQMRERIAAATDILAKIPGSLCVLTGEPGEWKPVYVSRQFPEQFGLSMAGFAEEVAKDPFYRLEMTSITRKRLIEKHLEMLSEDPYVGMFEMQQQDGTRRWTDVYLINSADHNGNRLRMLFYVDKDEERKAVDQQIAKAENASRMQQERAKAEILQEREKARQQVEEAQTTVRKEIEEAQARTQEQIESFRVKMNQVLESQKGSADDKENELRKQYEEKEQELIRSYSDKEKIIEKQLENYRKAHEAEMMKLQRSLDLMRGECDKQLADKQAEMDRLTQELKNAMDALRQSEEQLEKQRRAGELREKEQARNVERLQKMIDMQAAARAGSGAHTSAGSWFDTSGIPDEPDDDLFYDEEEMPESTVKPLRDMRPLTDDSLGRRTKTPVRPERREETPVRRNTVMDDLVEMAASSDDVIKEEVFSIDECLENIMVLQQPVCAGKKIRLELKKSISVPEKAVGDKAKLQRALVSLLESVAEQMPTNSVINLGCRADRASGNRVFLYFTIRDNESSIANELMQGMFENKSEKDDPLRAGLYIAREIISAMGGNVRVRSRRGEGTEITVTVCMKLPQT